MLAVESGLKVPIGKCQETFLSIVTVFRPSVKEALGLRKETVATLL